MPIKPKSFFSHNARIFCIDTDDTPADWFWRRVSMLTENEATDKKHEK